ncbi:MAG TPA: ABC transporter permease [Steroidobacteraceae bacterium]
MNAWRTIARDPAHTLVSVLGLTVGLGFFLLLLAYSRYSWSYDAQVPAADQVYVLKHRRNWELGKLWFDQMPMASREPAKALPGVADVTGYTNWFPLNVEMPGGLQPVQGLMVLPGFTKMMGIKPLQGDLDKALESPDGIAITESAARRLFGNSNVLGQAVTLRLDAADTNVARARIDAILPTPPANTTIPYEVLHGLKLSLLPEWAEDEALTGQRGFSGGYLLARLAPGASVDEVTAGLQELADHSPLAALVPEPVKAHAGRDKFTEVKLSPLRGAYLDQDVALNVFSTDVPRGDRRVIAGITVLGVLLLVLAAVNYVNLAVIRVLRRQREIMLRKVLGVGRRRLALQLLRESLLVSGLATVLGIVFAVAALPAFGALMDRNLQGMLSLSNALAALGVGLLVGLLTAIYPTWLALRVRPARMLAGRGDDESASARRLRRGLSVLQLALAMGLSGMTLAVALQARHAMDASPGFDPDHLLVARLPVGMSAKYTDQARSLREALAQHPAIAGVSVSNDALGDNREVWSTDFRRENGDLVFMEVKAVSGDFFETHGIASLAGRLFRSSDNDDEATSPLVLNAEAARALGYGSPQLAVGAHLQVRGMQMEMQDHEVIGIAPDIRFKSLREPTPPVVYMLTSVGAVLIARARNSVADAEHAMRELWPRYLTNSIPDIRPARQIFAASYADDARLARLLALSTLIALLIAGCGAFVLAADAVRRRTREIALRKLHGARRSHIGRLVARELGISLLLAATLGLPIAAVGIARYLAPFSDRTPLAYVAVVVALVMAAAVVAAGAARQAWLASTIRPADALR